MMLRLMAQNQEEPLLQGTSGTGNGIGFEGYQGHALILRQTKNNQQVGYPCRSKVSGLSRQTSWSQTSFLAIL
jgi:hypothetical protein